ncbi:hypothetical protein GCM10010252_60200 [Streptomyces aureoverticillatus]|nr:hypothetical protein GCM10010252_60200 [Streptomyces aureoverticillatus]
MLHERGGVGPRRIGVDMDQLVGGHGPAPAAYGVGHGRDKEVEGFRGGADDVEIT